MVKFNSSLENEKMFLDDIAMLGCSIFDEHVEELDKVLASVEVPGLKENIQKEQMGLPTI